MRRNRRFLAMALLLAVAPAGSTPPELRDVLAKLPPAAHAQLQRQTQQWAAWSPQQRARPSEPFAIAVATPMKLYARRP